MSVRREEGKEGREREGVRGGEGEGEKKSVCV